VSVPVEASADAPVTPSGDPAGDSATVLAGGSGLLPGGPNVLPGGMRGAVEAVLMVVEDPVRPVDLASALEVPEADVLTALRALAQEYDAEGRGFELREVAGGWRVFSRAAYAGVVERFVIDGQTAKLTQAALETLAIVAYRQPVSRARVSAVRGVNVDAVMRTLVTRGLVEETGSDPETGAILYRTTEFFLHRIGLTSLDELPALAPFLPELDALDELTTGGGAL
jgi:segregation and condensation protein B